MKKIGALWAKISKREEKYLSGVLEINGIKYSILIFKNRKREEDKQPMYYIFLKDDERQDNYDKPKEYIGSVEDYKGHDAYDFTETADNIY